MTYLFFIAAGVVSIALRKQLGSGAMKFQDWRSGTPGKYTTSQNMRLSAWGYLIGGVLAVAFGLWGLVSGLAK